MCTQKITEWITLKRFCCLVPLKEGTYISGFFLLVYCLYVEIQMTSGVYLFIQEVDESFNTTEPYFPMTPGLAKTDLHFGIRALTITDIILTHNIILGIMIAWTVINSILMISTSLMIFAAMKGKTIFLLQFLVISVTILIGNVAVLMLIIAWCIATFADQHYMGIKHGILEVLSWTFESVLLGYAFLVVRSYYCLVRLPAAPIRFKTLERQAQDSESGESSKT